MIFVPYKLYNIIIYISLLFIYYLLFSKEIKHAKHSY